jgi:RNA recognition motif-containing protein
MGGAGLGGPSNNAVGGGGMPHVPEHRRHQSPAGDEQLIPTAIVIKNIPFAVRKEMLLDLMISMRLPTPYAFNYHFDQGVFRGLAFANFSTAEETRAVIQHMDGLEVSGRKLRVEYKKMLPEAERERIEREKRERRGQLEEQHRGPMLHSQASIQSLASLSASQAGGGGMGNGSLGNSTGGGGNQSRPPTVRGYSSNMAAAPPWGSVDNLSHQQQQQQQQQQQRAADEINFNDPETLEFYTQLALFKRDDTREIHIFPVTVTPSQRRTIHVLAQHLGMWHESVGNGDSRQVHVSKVSTRSHVGRSATAMSSTSMDPSRSRPLNRAATFDFADQNSRAVSHNFNLTAGPGSRHGPTLEVPGSPDTPSMQPNSLRNAKSYTDLRSFSPTAGAAQSPAMTPAANHSTGGSGGMGAGMIGASTPTSAGFGGYGPVSPGSGGGGGSGGVGPGLTTAASANDLYSQFGGLNLTTDATPAAVRSNPGTIGSQRPGQAARAATERHARGGESMFRRANGLSSLGQGEW